jgi:hypothetical protein
MVRAIFPPTSVISYLLWEQKSLHNETVLTNISAYDVFVNLQFYRIRQKKRDFLRKNVRFHDIMIEKKKK